MTPAGEDEQPRRFSLIVGGPFNSLLGRAGGLDGACLPTPAAALCLALAAWLLPGLCAIAQGLVDPGYRAVDYFSDYSTLARLFIAVGVLVATERHADEKLDAMVREFAHARLVAGEARVPFFDALRTADRRSASGVAQALILGIAVLVAGQGMGIAVAVEVLGWEGRMTPDGPVLSWAGLAARWVGLPLFGFLVLLWLWRLLVWSMLLYRISRLPLQLVALHGDRAGGLGFVGVFPGVFRGFAFALSCVVASLLWKDLEASGASDVETLRYIGLAWLVFVMTVFVAPLFVFYAPLYALRERALREAAHALGTRYRAFQERWIDAGAAGPADDGGPSIGDMNNALDNVQGMRVLPVDRAAVVQLLLAAALPLVIVGATRIPLSEMLGRAVGIVL